MNKIEFINKLIKERKESKDNFISYSKTYPDEEIFTKGVKNREQEIQILEQIKTILEAWEVVKEDIIYQKNIPCEERPEYTYEFEKWIFEINENTYGFKEKSMKLKKALEVEEK